MAGRSPSWRALFGDLPRLHFPAVIAALEAGQHPPTGLVLTWSRRGHRGVPRRADAGANSAREPVVSIMRVANGETAGDEVALSGNSRFRVARAAAAAARCPAPEAAGETRALRRRGARDEPDLVAERPRGRPPRA